MSLAKQPCEKCYMIFEIQRNEPNTFGDRYQASFVFCPLHQAAPALVEALKRIQTAGNLGFVRTCADEAIATAEGR